MAITCVMFDLDGTLLNTLDDLAASANHTLEEFGYPTHPTDAYKYFVGNGMKVLINRIFPKEARDTEKEPQVLKRFIEYYSKHSLDNTHPYEGIEELVDALIEKGIKIGLVTNKSHNEAVAIMERFFGDKFDCVLGQTEKFPLKPNPESAIYATKQVGCTPENSIFVGDSGVDMKTGRDGGFYPVGVLWGFREREELFENGAKEVISYPSELLKIVFEKK